MQHDRAPRSGRLAATARKASRIALRLIVLAVVLMAFALADTRGALLGCSIALMLVAVRTRRESGDRGGLAIGAVGVVIAARLFALSKPGNGALGDTGRRGLRPSRPLVVSTDDEVIENLDIVADEGVPGIRAEGIKGLTVRNCRIRHSVGSHGINLSSCAAALIENCELIVPDAPASGPLARATNAIQLYRSPDTVIRKIRLRDCSTGIYGIESPRLKVSEIEGYNQRGPFPRGALVQFNRCAGSELENFYARNDIAVAFTEDNVSVFESPNCRVKQGLIDGNNSPSGTGVMFEKSDDGICADVDVIHFSSAAFAAYPAKRVLFLRCNARDSYRPTPRGEPGSKSLVFAVSPESADIRVSQSLYFAHANPANIIWDKTRLVEDDLKYQDFVPRPPLRLVGLPGQ
jgi:Right handed beta helix region